MLFKQGVLEKIVKGEVSLAFRKWQKQAVNSGAMIKTSIGLIKILNVSLVEISDIDYKSALSAGFTDKEELIQQLSKNEGNVYKISLSYVGADPRIKLREQQVLTDEAYLHLFNKLKRLDKYSKVGLWTLEVLLVIKDNPMVKASDLAIKLNREKEWMKVNVRKLKNLGLTVSHNPGYMLSPLGKYYIDRCLDSV